MTYKQNEKTFDFFIWLDYFYSKVGLDSGWGVSHEPGKSRAIAAESKTIAAFQTNDKSD